ncbi:MAG: DNA polymerase I [Candidatus Omnitrophica bacterium]|nr:DNA polymerase I [Candidatus Omnitrophota bacterium]
MDKAQVVLIDANGICYRAYYAIRGLATSYGLCTNAIYGFVNFLNKVLKEINPQYMGVCFDVSRHTFRQKEFARYKIQRPPMPADLVTQLPYIKKIIKAFGINIFEKEGFEADDVIATLTRKAKEKDFTIMIVSADKDILQLVDEGVIVLHPHKDKKIIYDVAGVKRQYGFLPGRIADFIALAGDTADNIPGVPGIGEKTATKLLDKFKSLENLLLNLDQIKEQKLRSRLKEKIEQIKLCHYLAQLRTDLDIEFDAQSLKIKKPDYRNLYEIFRELEFKKFLKDLPEQPFDKLRVGTERSRSASTESLDFARDKLRRSANRQVAGIDQFRQAGELILYMNEEGLTVYLPESDSFLELEKGSLKSIEPVLRDPKIKKIGHNLKDIFLRLARHNIALEGLGFDTMIAAYLLNPSRSDYSLESLCWDYLKRILDAGPVRSKTPGATAPPTAGTSNGAGKISPLEVCVVIGTLKSVLEKELKLKDSFRIFCDLEIRLIPVLAQMELEGIKLDLEFLKALGIEIEEKRKGLVSKIYHLAGGPFNINSPLQLRQVLFEKLKLPVIKKKKTGASTDEEVLAVLASQHPLPKILLEYRMLCKIKSTYIDALMELADKKTLRIHTFFNQTGTQTGRLSSSNPNLQNLPIKTELGRKIRKAFITSCEDNFLVSFDYSQVELRVLAHLSGEKVLIDAFSQGKDIHRATASLVYGTEDSIVNDQMREVAKRINFGIIYGLSSFGLARELGISREEATRFIDAYFLRYPRVKDYIARQIEKAKKDNFVTTILGRHRYLPDINHQNAAVRAFAERQAVNSSIQGSAADLIKMAMIKIYQKIEERTLSAKLLLQIHDELIFEIPNGQLQRAIEMISYEMENALALSVPIKVVIKKGKNWLEMEEIK